MWLRFIIIKPIGLAIARKQKYNLQYTGEEHAPFKGPFIVVSNHQTGVDVFALGLAIRKVISRSRMIPWAKTEIRKGREGLLGRILWHYLGTIPIDRDAEDEAPKAIKKSLEHLRKGSVIFIHPEGTRYPAGELGPFMYGVANLARAVPAPVLPVGIHRRESDGGIQVRIGVPFFMPDLEPEEEEKRDESEKPERGLGRQVDTLKEWAVGLDRDRKGMKLMAGMVAVVLDTVTRLEKKTGHDRFLRVASPADNEYLRDRILELLPPGWEKVEARPRGSTTLGRAG
jgi:1-acyl-sn-glycerol-3-phosphate acyltransferase